VLKSSSYKYFNFKNEYLGSKNGKIVVFIVKILQGKELLSKIEREMMKWLCSPLKIHQLPKIQNAVSRSSVKILQKFFLLS